MKSWNHNARLFNGRCLLNLFFFSHLELRIGIHGLTKHLKGDSSTNRRLNGMSSLKTKLPKKVLSLNVRLGITASALYVGFNVWPPNDSDESRPLMIESRLTTCCRLTFSSSFLQGYSHSGQFRSNIFIRGGQLHNKYIRQDQFTFLFDLAGFVWASSNFLSHNLRLKWLISTSHPGRSYSARSGYPQQPDSLATLANSNLCSTHLIKTTTTPPLQPWRCLVNARTHYYSTPKKKSLVFIIYPAHYSDLLFPCLFPRKFAYSVIDTLFTQPSFAALCIFPVTSLSPPRPPAIWISWRVVAFLPYLRTGTNSIFVGNVQIHCLGIKGRPANFISCSFTHCRRKSVFYWCCHCWKGATATLFEYIYWYWQNSWSWISEQDKSLAANLLGLLWWHS